jgi:hypothetical protein
MYLFNSSLVVFSTNFLVISHYIKQNTHLYVVGIGIIHCIIITGDVFRV